MTAGRGRHRDVGHVLAGVRVIMRKERPHPGAQLPSTDVDGHRLTALRHRRGGGAVREPGGAAPPACMDALEDTLEHQRRRRPALPRPGRHRPDRRTAARGVPGVSPDLAVDIIAEIGLDITRFSTYAI